MLSYIVKVHNLITILTNIFNFNIISIDLLLSLEVFSMFSMNPERLVGIRYHRTVLSLSNWRRYPYVMLIIPQDMKDRV